MTQAAKATASTFAEDSLGLPAPVRRPRNHDPLIFLSAGLRIFVRMIILRNSLAS
jgi:hypothetical protein